MPAVVGYEVHEVFLQGNFVEVGIHQAGSFGTSYSAPAGFHTLGSNRLGFVADPQGDGWENGVPKQTGDYFLPGTPEEGWSLEWTSPTRGEQTFSNFGLCGSFDIAQQSLEETSTETTCSAVWTGTAVSGDEKVSVIQNVHFDKDDRFFVISVTLTNKGETDLTDVEYLRNVDPDQEQPITGNFATRNYVAAQPAANATEDQPALVVAKGSTYGLTLGLGTIDKHARVSTEGFSNRDPDAILNSPLEYSEASPHYADEAIALAYRFETLASGQSVSFDYTYVLNENDLEEALGELAAVTILQPTGTVSGDNIVFQATTDDLADTTQIEFFVDGTSVGVDTAPDAGGVFDTTFGSFSLADGPVTLTAVATFADARTVTATSTVTVSNAGPPISFSTPLDGATFSGTAIRSRSRTTRRIRR